MGVNEVGQAGGYVEHKKGSRFPWLWHVVQWSLSSLFIQKWNVNFLKGACLTVLVMLTGWWPFHECDIHLHFHLSCRVMAGLWMSYLTNSMLCVFQNIIHELELVLAFSQFVNVTNLWFNHYFHTWIYIFHKLM